MKKRVLAALMAAVLVFAMTACGGAKQEAAAPAEEKEEAAEEPAEEVTLKFTGWRTEDQDAINAMNEKFTEAYPNIKVVYEPVTATEYDTNLQTSLANGTAADIIMMRSFGVGETVYSGGKIETLTTDNVPNLKNFPDSAIAAWAADGKSFAIPAGMTVEAVHYNKDIFEAAGIDKAPETVAELLEDCQKIKDAGYVPFACGVNEDWWVTEEMACSILAAVIGSNDWVQKLYAKEIDFTDPAYVTMLSTMKELTQYFPEFYDGLGYEECQQMFLTGQGAMFLSGSFELEYFMTTNPDLKLGCFAFPGQDAAPKGLNFTAAIGVGAYAESEHKEEALTYLNWLASDEGGTAYAEGVRGFFSPNLNAGSASDEIVQEWGALRDGKEMIHILGYETLNEQAPDFSTACAESVFKMCTEDLTPEEAAAYMQEQMSWYFQ